MVISLVSGNLSSITALLPSRNGEKYLNRLIPQILEMLSENDELIVINDGSTDSSASILAEHEKIDGRIKVLTTEGVGLVAALNIGIEVASKTWIARFDVDDEYSVDRISLQRELIGDDVAVIFSDYSFMSATGMRLGTVPSGILSKSTKLSLVSSQRTPHPVALMNRASVLEVGGYHATDFPAEDLGLWIKMLKVGKFLSVPEVLLRYRLSGGSISFSNRGAQLTKKNQIISDFGDWNILVENCVEEFEATVSCYLEHSQPTARLILHLRDISKASKLAKIEVSILALLAKVPFSTLIRIPSVFADILAKTLIRKLYRLSQNFL